MKKPVYLDYHATTPCDPKVLSVMLPYLGAEAFGNPSALRHKNGRRAADVVAVAREKVGALIGAVPEAITFTSGATEANNIALLGAAAANKSDRREILVSALEHDSILHAANSLSGYTVKVIPASKDGFITPAAVATLISDKTFFVSVLAVNHEIGTVQPVADIARMVRKTKAVLHCDATQGAGKIPLDVKTLDVDTLSLSAHKMYGPPGIGALYTKLDASPGPARVFFGGQQQKLRPGTIPLALTAGMGEACRLASERMEKDAAHLRMLTTEMLSLLQSFVPSLRINGALSPRVPGSLNFFVPGVAAEDVLLDLTEMLCLSTGAACRSGAGMPSGVLSAIGLTPEEINGAIRLSFGRTTTRQEMLFAVDALTTAFTDRLVRVSAA